MYSTIKEFREYISKFKTMPDVNPNIRNHACIALILNKDIVSVINDIDEILKEIILNLRKKTMFTYGILSKSIVLYLNREFDRNPYNRLICRSVAFAEYCKDSANKLSSIREYSMSTGDIIMTRSHTMIFKGEEKGKKVVIDPSVTALYSKTMLKKLKTLCNKLVVFFTPKAHSFNSSYCLRQFNDNESIFDIISITEKD